MYYPKRPPGIQPRRGANVLVAGDGGIHHYAVRCAIFAPNFRMRGLSRVSEDWCTTEDTEFTEDQTVFNGPVVLCGLCVLCGKTVSITMDPDRCHAPLAAAEPR